MEEVVGGTQHHFLWDNQLVVGPHKDQHSTRVVLVDKIEVEVEDKPDVAVEDKQLVEEDKQLVEEDMERLAEAKPLQQVNGDSLVNSVDL